MEPTQQPQSFQSNPQPVTPPQPVVSTPSMTSTRPANSHGRMRMILGSLLVVLVALGLYAWMSNNPGSNNNVGNPTPIPEEGVEVEKGDQLGTNQFQMPEGLPTNIPVETSIFESYKTSYNERGVEQWTVSYTSSATKDAKWTEYESFMKANGYNIVTNATDKTRGTIYGLKDNTGLLVVIAAEGGKITVRLNYFIKS